MMDFDTNIMSDGAKFVISAFKQKTVIDPSLYNPEELEVYLGTIAGLIEGIGQLVSENDRELYIKILDGLERVALK